MTSSPSPRRASLRELAETLPGRIEHFFVPDQMLPDGNVDHRVVQRRYRRMVVAIAGSSVVAFVPSMHLAGVPTDLWPAFVAGAAATAVVISGSLLAVPANSKAALLAALLSALMIFGLDQLIGDHYHEAPLLFAVVLAGHAVIQGFRAALVMAIAGGVLVPLTSTARPGPSPTESAFAFLYLFGIAAIVWTFRRLDERGAFAVHASEARFRELVERVPATVYTADFGPSGAWRYVSPQVEKLLGFPAEAWTSDPEFWWSRVHPEDRDRVAADEAASWTLPANQRSDIEYRMIGRDGRVRWVRDEATVVASGDGSPSHWSGILVDITEHKDLETHLSQAQRMETVGQLAGGIAHDFNNMLTAIRGYAELVRTDLAADARSREDLDEMLKATDRAATLTRQLLAFGRRQHLQPRVLDPAVVVEGLVPMLRRLLGEHIELVTRHTAGSGSVKADLGQLEQVLVNLAVNARDAMPDGGRLTIEIDKLDLDAGEVAEAGEIMPAAFVRITVADTGVGMDAATQERIFEPFFTTKGVGKGTGMGLATVYGIVRQSGGRIACASEPGRGATFTIDLPRVEQDAGNVEPDIEAPTTPRGSETILLVEDEEAVRSIARRVLVGLGYTVLEAASGADALGLAEARQDPIDLLVTDVQMPQMQGSELARRVRAVRPGLPVLFVSGFPGQHLGSGHDELAGLPLLRKPFDSRTLGLAVRAALDAPR